MNLYLSICHSLHIFATTAPPGGVHIFACPGSFRIFSPRACIFSHTVPVYLKVLCSVWPIILILYTVAQLRVTLCTAFTHYARASSECGSPSVFEVRNASRLTRRARPGLSSPLRLRGENEPRPLPLFCECGGERYVIQAAYVVYAAPRDSNVIPGGTQPPRLLQ